MKLPNLLQTIVFYRAVNFPLPYVAIGIGLYHHPGFRGASRIVSEDSPEGAFPADCPHSVPFGVGDARDVPANSDV